MHRKIKLKTHLVQLCAITCVFGEKMNLYVPGASLAFTILGMLLVILNLIIPNHSCRLLEKYDCINLRLLECIAVISLVISLAKFLLGYSTSFFDELRQFFLLIIVLNIVLVMIKDSCLITQFMKFACYSFSITFIASYGLMYGTESRHTGFFKDPNSMGRVAIFCTFFAIYLLINKKNNKLKHKLPVVVSLIISVSAFFLSGSRGCFVGVLVCAFWLVATSSIPTKRKMQIIAVGIIGIVLLSGVAMSNEEFLQMVLRYLGMNENGDSYSENIRLMMWKEYIRNIGDFILIGNFDGQPKSYFMLYRSAHNSLIEMMVTHGVMAFVPFLIVQIRFFIRKTEKDFLAIVMKGVFITLFVSSMFISTNDEKIAWLSYAMMLIPTATQRQRISELRNISA